VMFFHATGWPILFGVALFMGIGTALNSSAALNYTAELYPTRMRGIGVASGTSMSRLASIVSPSAVGALLAADLGIQSVFAMFGIAGLIGFAIMAALGVETKQRTLEDLSP
jgi:putative MFS transporter